MDITTDVPFDQKTNYSQMRQLIFALIFSLFIAGCGSKQSKTTNLDANKMATVQSDSTKNPQSNATNMWKTVSYAGNLGDNKNSAYITNTYAIWGTYSKGAAENGELKVKFLIDRVSFCMKLYENGTKIVTKGDESSYRITIKPEGNEPLQLSARNVSDRVFISETDAKSIIELFNKGGRISFTLVNDSKTSLCTYSFALDHPEGFGIMLAKLTK